MKKIVAIIIAITIVVASCCVIKIEVNAKQDNHEWEVIPSRTAYGYAKDENGNTLIHYYCLICGEDLTKDAEQRIWEKYDCGKGADFWKKKEEYCGNVIDTAKAWHKLYYNRTCDNIGHQPVDTSWTEPAYYECKLCGQRKSIDGGRYKIIGPGCDCYDEAGNYIGIATDKEVGINEYCLQHNLKPKYYEAAPSMTCPYYTDDPGVDDESYYSEKNGKLYDKDGNIVKGPQIVYVEINKGSYIQCADVFVDSNNNIIKDNYLVFGSTLYYASTEGSLSKKTNITVVTYNKYLYRSDGNGNATILPNQTFSINGVVYQSDSNGYVKAYKGTKGNSVDSNDPANNPSGTGYKNEYRNGVWYDGNGKASSTYRSGHWTSDSKGWWYQDGSYFPVSSWVKIDGYWYYFCADGYMDYSEYREGYWLNDDGSWNTAYAGGHWTQNSTGWWYEDNGWFPASEYLWVDGVQYWFNGNGYWE